MRRQAIFFMVLLAGASQVIGAPPFPSKELVEIAARHKLPMPPKGARLVLAHTKSWTVLGNGSASGRAGIYSPAFLLAEKDGETTILRGTKKVVLHKQRREPLWRPFSLEPVQTKGDGYVARFNTLEDFACAVQLAARGEEKDAQRIWERFASAKFRTELAFGEAVPEKPDSPTAVLGVCLFDHLFREVLRSPADWPEIKDRVEKLFVEFPALKTKERTTLLDSLAASVKSKPPDAKSTEALLVDWSRRPGELRHLGLFADDNDKVNGPAREIVLRGFDAVPDLISLINDQRITVHLDPRGGRETILRLGELALTLLAEISGKQLTEVESWDAWWAKARQMKEEDFFAAAAFQLEEGKITWVNPGPVRILGRKYPARLTLLCEEFSKRGLPKTQPFSLAEAVAESPQPLDKRVQILAEFALRGSLAHKRSVLQVLAKLDGKKCSELLRPILKTLPPDSKDSYWTCEEAAYTHVVMQIEEDDIWREYLRAAKRSSIGLRMEMMNPMNYTYIGAKNRQRRLAFLAAFLDDAAVRDKATDPEKFGGPSAGFTIPKIAVRDFVADIMASILGMDDDLDKISTAADWNKLREKVRTRLAAEKLPDLAGK